MDREREQNGRESDSDAFGFCRTISFIGVE